MKNPHGRPRQGKDFLRENLATLMLREREERGLSQEDWAKELSRKMGVTVSQTWIARMERRGISVTGEWLERLSTGLGVSKEYLSLTIIGFPHLTQSTDVLPLIRVLQGSKRKVTLDSFLHLLTVSRGLKNTGVSLTPRLASEILSQFK